MNQKLDNVAGYGKTFLEPLDGFPVGTLEQLEELEKDGMKEARQNMLRIRNRSNIVEIRVCPT